MKDHENTIGIFLLGAFIIICLLIMKSCALQMSSETNAVNLQIERERASRVK